MKTWFALPLAGLLSTSLSHAEEPRKVSEPSVLREPSEVVQVVDAFDDDDLFDLHLSLGYQSTWKSADILRESSLTDAGFNDGGYSRANLNVARYSERVSRLNTRADIGLFKDLALVIRMPIVLSDDRELKGLSGSENNQPLALAGAPGEQLFSLPFKSPTRSGIEYLAVGIDASPMNQARDSTKPTWMLGIEGRFSLGEPMRACNKNPRALNPNAMLDPATASELACAYPSDINRDGTSGQYPAALVDGGSLEGSFRGGRKPGVSRGTTGLELHTMISRRVKYLEPYGGFRALIEFQNEGSDFGSSDIKGSLVNHPPLRGTMIFGLNVIPYEIREQFQRLAFDFRFTGTYVSEGRDYSELFDALGSSDAATLRYPSFAEYQAGPGGSVVNPNSQRVYFTGLTDVQQYGVYTLSGSVNWQVGEFVKFNVGGGYTIMQSHFITFDQACNPDFANDLSKAGPCKAAKSGGTGEEPSGIPNPNYRRTINDPGHRFKVSGSSAFDAWINATVMF